MLNNVTLVGNLGHDPELQYLPDGKPVCNLQIAVSSGKKTLWIRATAWEGNAELCAEHLHKGDQVAIAGELTEPGAWVSKQDGRAIAEIRVNARLVRFGHRAAKNNGQAAPETIVETESIPF